MRNDSRVGNACIISLIDAEDTCGIIRFLGEIMEDSMFLTRMEISLPVERNGPRRDDVVGEMNADTLLFRGMLMAKPTKMPERANG